MNRIIFFCQDGSTVFSTVCLNPKEKSKYVLLASEENEKGWNMKVMKEIQDSDEEKEVR